MALLRAVNVGGTGLLSMTKLRELCEEAGFEDVRTYIQSGNVLFRSRLTEAKVKAKLEKALTRELGKPATVFVRSASEIASVVRKNPFASKSSKFTIALFLDKPAPKTALKDLVAPGGEEVKLSGREIFIFYPNGQGRSKLVLPIRAEGTARNMNTVAKLADLACE